ncbi:hypothetical protein WJX81_004732 [Elliptochloris bilobata]|uniref:Complex 1 LYR protein domain-containing protein n=1 Tax=Elliptochloris bilobata TaxID=381761 RepID=A0AAW1RN27_9CHLO
MPAPRISGLQRKVFSLYRSVLRAARSRGAQQQDIKQYARAELERYRHTEKKNFQLIEHLIRRGTRQVEMLNQPDVSGVVV